MTRVFVIALALVIACGGRESPPSKPPPTPVDVTLSKTRDRVFEAEQRLAEHYQLNSAVDLLARIAFLGDFERSTPPAAKSDAHSKAPPKHDTLPEVPEWAYQHATARIAQLEARLHEYELRGSTDAYRAAATIDVELERLREMAEEAGLPPDVVPNDALQLLDHARLVRLDEAWMEADRALTITEAKIGLPSESRAAAAERIRSKRQRIRAALDQPPSAIKERFILAPKRAAVEDSDWVWKNDQSREHLIDMRERDLLQKALAQDGSDIPALRRLDELRIATPEVLSSKVAAAAMDLARTLNPTEAISNKFYDRLHDPVRAAWRDAVLELKFEHDRSRLPPDLKSSRTTWELSFLDDGALAERFAWLRHTLDAFDKLDAQLAAPLQSQLDRDQLHREYDEMTGEIVRRQGGARSHMYEPDAQFIDSLLSEVPTDITQLKYVYQRSFFRSLELLSARGYEAPTMRSLITDLTVEGFRAEAKWVASHLALCKELRQQLTMGTTRESLMGYNDSLKLEGAELDLMQVADRIHAGLDELSHSGVPTERVEAIRKVLPERLTGCQPCASMLLPKDKRPKVRDAPRAFDDPKLMSMRKDVSDTLHPIREQLEQRLKAQQAAEDAERFSRLRDEMRAERVYDDAIKDIEHESFWDILGHARE